MIRKFTPAFVGLIALPAFMLYIVYVLYSREAECKELHQVNDCILVYTPVRTHI